MTTQLIAAKIPTQMENADNYQIKYWNDTDGFNYKSSKPERSIKRKLTIVISFILILAITPSLILYISDFEKSNSKKVSIVNDALKSTETPRSYEVTIELPKEKSSSSETQVQANDNYWKISKRVCGDGKFYLSIQSQNGGKALRQGDSVVVNCTL